MYVIKFGELLIFQMNCVKNPIVTTRNHISKIHSFKEYIRSIIS